MVQSDNATEPYLHRAPEHLRLRLHGLGVPLAPRLGFRRMAVSEREAPNHFV
jgi:hypothetical protein